MSKVELLTILSTILKCGDEMAESPGRYGYASLAVTLLGHTDSEAIAISAAHLWASALAKGLSAYHLGHMTPQYLVSEAKGIMQDAEDELSDRVRHR